MNKPLNKILLDTSIIIDYLRIRNKNSTILKYLADKNYKLFISIISHTELYAGKNIWKEAVARKELELVLSGLEILNLDKTISIKAGKIRSEYNLEITDSIIASTALSYKLKLATLNVRDFKDIKAIQLLDFSKLVAKLPD